MDWRVIYRYWFVAICFVLCAPVLSASAQNNTDDYDQLNARGLQLVVNGSFEKMNRAGDMPDSWGVPKDVRDRFKIITDEKRSKHGSTYVIWDLEKPRFLYGQLKSVPSGKLQASAWVKGKGMIRFNVSFRAKRWRTLSKKNKFLYTQTSEKFIVNTSEWTRYAYEFDIPESFDKIDGRPRELDLATFRIWVKGKIALDQCSAVVENNPELPAKKEKSRQKIKGQNPGADLRPMFTMPKLAKAPVIDGGISEDEWSSAAALTGFTELNTNKLSQRQAMVYAGYDDKNLYFAFRCPHEGKIGMGKPERDRHAGHQTDAIEIWLVPTSGEWFQFLGIPGGGIIDSNKSQSLAWNGNWEFRNSVEDSGETIGGILSFHKKIWTAEISIPFKDLGVLTPKDGETWRINFTRDYSVKSGKIKFPADWTTWSPIKGRFKSPNQFGAVVFQSEAPAIQLHSIGDPVNGEVSVEGIVTGGKCAVRINTRTTLPGIKGKTISFRSTEVDAYAAGSTSFKLSDTLKVNGATDLVLQISAEDAKSGQMFAKSRIPFTARAALRLKLIPVVTQGKLFVNVDGTRVQDLPDKVSVVCDIYKNNSETGVSVSDMWRGNRPQGDLEMNIADLAPGEYRVKVFLKDRPKGKSLASSVASFIVPKKPEWLGAATDDISNIVPAPWTPVEVTNDLVRITQREYRLGALGLPDQITVLGEELFAAPATLRLVISGKEVAFKATAPKLVSHKKDQAVWHIKGSAGPLTLEGTLTIEFDGLALLEFRLNSTAPVAIDTLALEFPLNKDRAMYARGEDGISRYFANLYNEGQSKTTVITASKFSHSGWAWPNRWVHHIWVGDDERGFSIMCESPQFHKGKKHTEIKRTPEANTLKIYLIDGRYNLLEPLRYQYMWQATPVKPRPDNPKVWHAAYYSGKREKRSGNPKYVTVDMWQLKYTSYAAYRISKQAFEKKNKALREQGVKVVPYFGTGILTNDVPELQPFLKEWEIYPIRLHSGGPQGSWLNVCVRDPSLRDYYVHTLKKIIDELGFDGLYLDVSREMRCSNHYHGCGYQDADSGEWQPAVNILANRDLYKRFYIFNKSEGRDAVLFYHNMPPPAFAGFVDVTTQGEEWCREGNDQYDRLTPEIFRVKEMKIQYGTPFTWYSFHHYYRGLKFGGRVPLCTILAYTLPHRVLHTVHHVDGMEPVWKITDQFWTSSEFIPYWSPQSPVEIKEHLVLGSVFLKKREKRALLIVANWNREPRTVDVKINVAKMGMDPARVKVTRAVDHPILQPEDPPEGDRMENKPLQYRDGCLRLELGRRNLEIILIESRSQ